MYFNKSTCRELAVLGRAPFVMQSVVHENYCYSLLARRVSFQLDVVWRRRSVIQQFHFFYVIFICAHVISYELLVPYTVLSIRTNAFKGFESLRCLVEFDRTLCTYLSSIFYPFCSFCVAYGMMEACISISRTMGLTAMDIIKLSYAVIL